MTQILSPALMIIVLSILAVQAKVPLKILGVFPHPAISHFQFFAPIMRGLAEAGHQVTVISHFPDKNPPQGYRDFVLTNQKALYNSIDLKLFETQYFINHFFEFKLLHDWGLEACNGTLQSPALAQVLQERVQYDVVIMEQFNTDCLLGLAHVLKAPVIGLSSADLMLWHYDRMGAPMFPSYMSTSFLGLSDNMTFADRLGNWLTYHIINTLYRYITVPATDALLRQKFGNNLPSVQVLAKETSLFFVNHHFSLNEPKPRPPSIIELGGIHIKPAQPLDSKLQQFLDDATDGVVFISWGSMIRANSLSPAKRDGIVKAAKRLKQRVIWKWENDTLPNKPDNMLISKWLPQRDILCHPNVKVFMTHAGLMGSSEAAYCGVPVVSTPMYGDQFMNAASMESRGMGVILYYSDISEESVLEAVNKVMEPSYVKSAKIVSETYRNRPQTALETALWWVEYVANTKGAPLTKSASVYMSGLSYHSVDVYLFLVGLFIIFVLCWTWIIRKCCTENRKTDKIKKN